MSMLRNVRNAPVLEMLMTAAVKAGAGSNVASNGGM